MKYIIIPFFRLLAVLLLCCFYPIQIGVRVMNFLWEFSDDWYKQEFPKGQPFHTSKEGKYIYRTALDFILNRKVPF